MAKIETTLKGDFVEIMNTITDGILNTSMSASLEDTSDFHCGSSRCSVSVYERYSMMGDNRVSMNVTLFQGEDGVIHLSAITSGGSQALLFKVNTWGEEAFLDVLQKIIDEAGW